MWSRAFRFGVAILQRESRFGQSIVISPIWAGFRDWANFRCAFRVNMNTTKIRINKLVIKRQKKAAKRAKKLASRAKKLDKRLSKLSKKDKK